MTKPTKNPNLHSTDKALLEAARTGEGTIPLTPEIAEQMQSSFKQHQREYDEEFPKLVAACDYKTRLAITAQVFQAILDHAKERGSFRYLIYERLGFDFDAYVPLYLAGGMTISNEFELKTEKEEKQ